MQWAASKNRETCSGCSLIKKLRVEFFDSDRLQLIAICWNRRWVWTEHPHTSHFLVFHAHILNVAHVTLAQGVLRASFHVIMRLVVRLIWYSSTLYWLSTPCFPPSLSSSFSFPCSSLSSSMLVGSMRSPMRASADEDIGTMAENNPLTDYLLQNYGCCDRTVMVIEQDQIAPHPKKKKPAARNCSRNNKSNSKQKGNWDVDQMSHVDHVTTHAHSSQGESQLYIFEDNEAGIKMIINGRSPTMRHVSRTHRVALDWLFDRINLDSKIQIRYIDTKHQLADILTKSWLFDRVNLDRKIEIKHVDTQKPTRRHVNQRKLHTWWVDHLLRLLNIMNLSMFSCSHFLSNRKQSVVSKRVQETTLKERSAVAKPRPMNLVSKNLLSAKKEPPQDLSDPNSPGNQELDQNWCFLKLAAETCCATPTKTQQCILSGRRDESIFKLSPRQETERKGRITKSESRICTSAKCRSPRMSSRICRKSWISQKTHHQFDSKRWRRPTLWSGDCLCRQQWKPPFTRDKTTMMIWKYTGIRTSRHFKNLFHPTQKLVLHHQMEILNVKSDWMDIFFMDAIYTFSWLSNQVDEGKKVRVYPDSVLCLGKMSDHSAANRRWEGSSARTSTVRFFQRIIWSWRRTNLSSSVVVSRVLRRWKCFRESRKICKIKKLNLRHLEVESSSCRCSMTLNGQSEEIQNSVLHIPSKLRTTRRDSRKGTGHSFDLGVNWIGMELKVNLLREKGDSTATQMVKRLQESGHAVFKRISALHHALHCGCFEHSALISNDSLSKSAQYLRSSWLLVWRVWSEAGWSSRRQKMIKYWKKWDRKK